MKSISFRRLGLIVIVFVAALGAEVYFVYFRSVDENGQKKAPPAAHSSIGNTLLDGADELELYSIDPDQGATENEESFRDYRVLGKTVVKDKGLRRVIGQCIDGGLSPAWCFFPRHAVLAKFGEKNVDLVICFECGHLELYE